MKYMILESENTGDLMLRVCRDIENGYVPTGGMVIETNKYGRYEDSMETQHTYYQAMTKPNVQGEKK